MALIFSYDFSSSYSYLAAMRMEALAHERGVEVVWRPFLLGPIFADAGYGGSPNLAAPAKAAYMWRDLERRAAAAGLPFVRPSVFPQKSVLAGRAALAVSDEERPGLTRAIFTQAFADGRDVAEVAVVADAIRAAGLNADDVIARTQTAAIKQALFDAVDAAKTAGIFGAPSFTVGEELFWGNETLEDALSMARLSKGRAFSSRRMGREMP